MSKSLEMYERSNSTLSEPQLTFPSICRLVACPTKVDEQSLGLSLRKGTDFHVLTDKIQVHYWLPIRSVKILYPRFGLWRPLI